MGFLEMVEPVFKPRGSESPSLVLTDEENETHLSRASLLASGRAHAKLRSFRLPFATLLCFLTALETG